MPARTPGRVIPPGAADFDARLRSIERQLAALSRAPAMPETSQQGGSYVLIAPDGTELVRFGDYNDADAQERYGLALFDASGNIVLANDESDAGLIWPGDNQQWGTTTPQTITSGTITDYYSTMLLGINGDAIYAQGAIATGAGTTAEVRVRYANGGGTITGTTNTVTIPAATSATWVLSWLHPFPVGLAPAADLATNLATLYLEVRRASGAGNVTLYRPRVCWVGTRRALSALSAPAVTASALSYV